MSDSFDTAALAARVDAAVAKAIAENRIVGAVVLVAKDGAILHRGVAGLADREAGRPMTEDAIFRLASVTKPLVAAATLSLIEAGALTLDTPVSAHLPRFRPRLADGTTPDILVRHLLTHTAGLAYGFKETAGGPYRAAGVSDGLEISGLTLDENLERIAAVPLRFAPGTGWYYSVAIDVLGALLQAVTGETLPEIIAARVTRPLGLADTAFGATDPDRLAVPYADGDPAPLRMAGRTEVDNGEGTWLTFDPDRVFDPAAFPSGGAGMAGTAGDILRFLEALRTGGAPILGAETVAEGSANQIGDLPREADDAGWRFGFFGAVLDDPAAAKTPQGRGTLQWGGAYGHTWFIDPAAGLSAVYFTNTAMEGVGGAFPTEIRDAIYG
ncbi:serine hydrolase domain-containing protein [Prosthecomicrobium pneumaticum]|uniref:CubicO group peptidase (Beta-lactamase class C family) n=1 Tax=Prosthecomicrobium pneumaticum TaxID=81895 RepID=A0A7W9FP01_9HYPH|nr:serine hydrolase domain-containing protein [Prosthecomicrobium pneumaticum]MBB5754219.1 CubicO group peptidase (beta-lactamase class C family) [Prosthecomicrobium pneumaticum]